MAEVTFFLLRYALLPAEEQLRLDAEPLPDPRGLAVLQAINLEGRVRQFTYWNHDFALVGFQSLDDGEDGPRYVGGQLAKHQQQGIHELTETEIVEHMADDWKPIWVVIDSFQQYIVVEKNTTFGQSAHISNALEEGLNPPIRDTFGHRLKIEPVTRSAEFWDIVEDHPYLFEIDLSFVSPNIFNVPQTMREALEDLREAFNQDEADVSLSNSDGELRANRERLEDAIDYISEGEGSWVIQAADEPDKARKRRYTSKDYIEQFEMDVPRAGKPVAEGEADPRRSILQRFLDLFA